MITRKTNGDRITVNMQEGDRGESDSRDRESDNGTREKEVHATGGR